MGKDKEQIAFRVTPQMKREIDLIMDSDGVGDQRNRWTARYA